MVKEEPECEHTFKLSSEIPFAEKEYWYCGNFKDIEYCTKCGKVNKVVK